MTDPTALAIETVGLTKHYGDVVAVDNLDLAIPTGSVFGFIGPNGAGKSSILRILVGLTRRTAGQARILGFDAGAREPALRRRVGYVPEVPTVYRWMRVREAIDFCRTLHETWNDELCRDLVARFGLTGDQKVGGLSRGMSAKLSLLLALAHEPELLILDEPTLGLDPIAREEFLDGVLQALCEGPRTVLLSSHVLSDVQRMADNVGILFQGRLLASSSTEELMRSTRRLRVVFEDGAVPEAALERHLGERGGGCSRRKGRYGSATSAGSGFSPSMASLPGRSKTCDGASRWSIWRSRPWGSRTSSRISSAVKGRRRKSPSAESTALEGLSGSPAGLGPGWRAALAAVFRRARGNPLQ